jgi:hypothetical protein
MKNEGAKREIEKIYLDEAAADIGKCCFYCDTNNPWFLRYLEEEKAKLRMQGEDIRLQTPEDEFWENVFSPNRYSVYAFKSGENLILLNTCLNARRNIREALICLKIGLLDYDFCKPLDWFYQLHKETAISIMDDFYPK